MEKSCAFCSAPFEVDTTKRNWGSVKLCSDKCRKGVAAASKRAEYVPKRLEAKPCVECAKKFIPARQGAGKQLYCSRKCFLKRKADKAQKKWADSVEEKRCENCGSVFVPKKFGGGKQIYCSPNCQVAAINARRPAYKRASRRKRTEFKVMRLVALDRDKKCVICGSNRGLHVHHWDCSGQRPNCDNSLPNLATLCGRCHRDIHGIALVKVNGQWGLDGKIFEKLKIKDPIPIHR